MKLSVFYDHVLEASAQSGKSLDEVLKLVRSWGIGALEIRLSHMEEDPDAIARIRRAGLAISCVFGFYEMGIRDESEKIRRHIRMAEISDSKNIMIVPGFIKQISISDLKKAMPDFELLRRMFDRSEEIAGMARGMEQAARMGNESGITVLFEDFDDYSSPLSGLNGVLWFLEKIKGIKMAFDTGNFIMYGEDVMGALESVIHRVAHVHCKDRSDVPVAVGGGYIPVADVVKRLGRTGYDGYFAIEHFGAADQLECMRTSAIMMKSLAET